MDCIASKLDLIVHLEILSMLLYINVYVLLHDIDRLWAYLNHFLKKRVQCQSLQTQSAGKSLIHT